MKEFSNYEIFNNWQQNKRIYQIMLSNINVTDHGKKLSEIMDELAIKKGLPRIQMYWDYVK